MTRTAVIMQPTYMPWLGYFDLIDQSDVFVFYDEAQFSKQSWHQRNRIRTPQGLEWLTVPIRQTGRFPLSIRDAEIARDHRFPQQHLRGVELNYHRAPYFDAHFPGLREILLDSEPLLGELNMRLIRWLAEAIGIEATVRMSSELDAPGKRSGLMVNICRRIDASRYLSPLGSAVYMADECSPTGDFGIDVVFQHYEHPVYRQRFDPFLPYASVLDLLFNEGPRSLEVIRSGRRPPLTLAQALARTRGGASAQH